jgi:hypothetical protein
MSAAREILPLNQNSTILSQSGEAPPYYEVC